MQAGASVGVGLFPDHGTTQEDLYRHVDQALYEAKRAGRGAWQWCQISLKRRLCGRRARFALNPGFTQANIMINITFLTGSVACLRQLSTIQGKFCLQKSQQIQAFRLVGVYSLKKTDTGTRRPARLRPTLCEHQEYRRRGLLHLHRRQSAESDDHGLHQRLGLYRRAGANDDRKRKPIPTFLGFAVGCDSAGSHFEGRCGNGRVLIRGS